MKTMEQIQERLDEIIQGAIDGTVHIRQANAVGRLIREKARLYSLLHRSAESQNKLDQLNEFYGIK